MNAGRLKVFINIIFFGLVALFLFSYFKNIDFNLLTNLDLKPDYLLYAIIFALGFRFWCVYIWKKMLNFLKASNLPGFSVLSRVYSKAWLGRYVPGKVTMIAGKVYFAAEHGISKKKLAVSSILESLVQIISSLAISMLFLTFDERFSIVDPRLQQLMLATSIILAITLVPSIFNGVIALVLKVLGKSELQKEMRISAKLVLFTFCLYVVGYFISGSSYFFLTGAMQDINIDTFLYVIAVFNIAGAIGTLAIFAPSGIGVREVVLLLLLPAIMSKEAAIVITVLARLFSTLIDLLFVAICHALARKKVA